MYKLSLLLLASNLAFPCIAQTGRIALFSHSGSTVALAMEATDNFGVSYVEQEWKKDSIVAVSESVVEHRGLRRMRYVDTKEGASPWKRAIDSYSGKDAQWLQAYFPKAVVVDVAQKKPARKKPSSNIRLLPKRPFQYCYWRGLAGVAALGAVGWLLGRKPGPPIG